MLNRCTIGNQCDEAIAVVGAPAAVSGKQGDVHTESVCLAD